MDCLEEKMKNKLEINTIEQITMLLQIALAIFLVSFGVASLFAAELFIICQVLIGLLMFIIAYNNQKIYKRKYMTPIYLGLGIIIIASAFFG